MAIEVPFGRLDPQTAQKAAEQHPLQIAHLDAFDAPDLTLVEAPIDQHILEVRKPMLPRNPDEHVEILADRELGPVFERLQDFGPPHDRRLLKG